MLCIFQRAPAAGLKDLIQYSVQTRSFLDPYFTASPQKLAPDLCRRFLCGQKSVLLGEQPLEPPLSRGIRILQVFLHRLSSTPEYSSLSHSWFFSRIDNLRLSSPRISYHPPSELLLDSMANRTKFRRFTSSAVVLLGNVHFHDMDASHALVLKGQFQRKCLLYHTGVATAPEIFAHSMLMQTNLISFSALVRIFLRSSKITAWWLWWGQSSPPYLDMLCISAVLTKVISTTGIDLFPMSTYNNFFIR